MEKDDGGSFSVEWLILDCLHWPPQSPGALGTVLALVEVWGNLETDFRPHLVGMLHFYGKLDRTEEGRPRHWPRIDSIACTSQYVYLCLLSLPLVKTNERLPSKAKSGGGIEREGGTVGSHGGVAQVRRSAACTHSETT